MAYLKIDPPPYTVTLSLSSISPIRPPKSELWVIIGSDSREVTDMAAKLISKIDFPVKLTSE
jgi:hypothetical protein